MFEATLAIIQSKATTAAIVSRKIADGTAEPGALASALSTEWSSLAALMTISIANIVLGVWRPRLAKKRS